MVLTNCGWTLQKQKEKLHRKIHELQRELDAKQTLELEIERLRGAVLVMKHMGEDDVDEKKKLDAIKMELQDKEEEWEGIEQMHQTLVIKERKTNDELQDARKELISVCMFYPNINVNLYAFIVPLGFQLI